MHKKESPAAKQQLLQTAKRTCQTVGDGAKVTRSEVEEPQATQWETPAAHKTRALSANALATREPSIAERSSSLDGKDR